MENLQTFVKEYPKQHISVSACYDYATNLREIMNFVDKNNIDVVQFSKVAESDNYYNQFSNQQKLQFFNIYDDLEKEFIEKAIKNKLNKAEFLNRFFGLRYASFAYHPLIGECKPKVRPFGSTCVPGEKLYIEADGNIIICEKVNNKCKIGHVDTGLDYKIIAKIMNEFNNMLRNHCNQCTVSRLCGICLRDLLSTDKLNYNENKCNNVYLNSKNMMQKYVSLLEQNPTLFDEITSDYYNMIDLLGELI